MVITRSNKIATKHNLKANKSFGKGFSIRLKRLSLATLKRYARNDKNITHTLGIRIRNDKMEIGDSVFVSKHNNFNICMKVSHDNVVVIDDDDKQSQNVPPQKHSDLRPRLNVVESKSNNKLINSAWQLCKENHKENKHEICINDIVMAKLRGYSAWPAIVIEIFNKNRVKVEFFGADPNEKIGFVTVKEITLFDQSEDIILLLLKRNNSKFNKAVQEVEMLYKIPESICLSNQIN